MVKVMNAISCMGKPWIGSNKEYRGKVSSIKQLGIEPPKITATVEKARCVLDICQCLLYNANFEKCLANIKLL